MHRLPGPAVPEDGRLALVLDADRVEGFRAEPRARERCGGRLLDAAPDLFRVVLDPARPREVLRQLGVPLPLDGELRVDDEARRARGALVDRER